MNTEVKSLVEFFCLFPGGDSNDFSKIKPFAEKLGHPDLTVHSDKGLMDKNQWLNFIEKFASEGEKMDLISIMVKGDNAIVYKVRITFADGTEIEQVVEATFKDGRLFRVERNTPKKYSGFFEMRTNDADAA